MRLSHIVASFGPSLVNLGNPVVVWEDSTGENANITCRLTKDKDGKWKVVMRPLKAGEDPPPDFLGDIHVENRPIS